MNSRVFLIAAVIFILGLPSGPSTGDTLDQGVKLFESGNRAAGVAGDRSGT